MFFKLSKWSKSAKQLFNRNDFGKVQNKDQRSVYLGGTVIKITKSNGQYTVNCRQAAVRALVQATRTRHKYRTNWGRTHKTHIQKWRALTAGEIQKIYKECNKQIAGRIKAYKRI
ncbi:hypothetical protein TVAG_076990 [Trichomonas vaginalis G3]|uniref:Uncharacterized protein n=1 Tax=Trichomonas vaginalis (strain ATCC PRA-98 / G3) TaxID=412133 RepID=A2D9U6_TRIV3|nr:hypothetical protein TVAGG3_0291360 [Trichomonas vaginalis G3]EAY22952.1 hypothetical protein TVAG_076990 [Trichomonas vaginalis G3]KAI5527296.1 hypothetical protein TVAGG3_0291360 [Trichomonas vaginalis G3]|eukprot:XP_001583938.1 hypothetical protein [Trichomonas vaginalis G3]